MNRFTDYRDTKEMQICFVNIKSKSFLGLTFSCFLYYCKRLSQYVCGKSSGSHVLLLLLTHLALEVACVDIANCFLIFPLPVTFDIMVYQGSSVTTFIHTKVPFQ